jgi:hypothetical protein
MPARLRAKEKEKGKGKEGEPADAGASVDASDGGEGEGEADAGMDAGPLDAGAAADGGADAGGLDAGDAGSCRFVASLVLSTQADVVANADVCVVGGDLTISQSALSAVSLPLLDSVGGTLTIADNSSLQSVSLPLLESVFAVVVTSSAALTTLQVPALATVEQDLGIEATSVESLTLPALTTAGGVVRIAGNELAGAVSLPELATAGSVIVESNTALQSVDLSSLATVSGNVSLWSNGALPSVLFPRLTAVAGSISITLEGALELLWLLGLETVGGTVRVDRTGLLGLNFAQLTSVGDDFIVVDNTYLGSIAAASMTTVGQTVTIDGNSWLFSCVGALIENVGDCVPRPPAGGEAPTVRTGFPVDIPQLPNGLVGGGLFPVAAHDLDRDGEDELVLLVNNEPSYVVVYRTDGVEALSPIVLDDYTFLQSTPPVFADVDVDGRDEMVFLAMRTAFPYEVDIVVLEADGTPAAGWPRPLGVGGTPSAGIVAADLDDEPSTLELAVAHVGEAIITDADGVPLPGFPMELPNNASGSSTPSAAIGQLDDDPALEVVFAAVCEVEVTTETTIRVVNVDASVGMEAKVPGCAYWSPVVGDVDGDGEEDVVIGTTEGLYVFERDGAIKSGWPLFTDLQLDATPVLVDLDGDGLPEIVAALGEDRTVALHGDGSFVPGWPARPMRFPGSFSGVAGDVNGDGEVDLLISTPPLLEGFSSDGLVLPGFPLEDADPEFPVVGSPLVRDLDGDGAVEVVFLTSDAPNGRRLWVLDTAAAYGPTHAEWPTFQHDRMRSGRYGHVVPASPADAGPSDGGASDGGASDGGASDGGASDGGASDGGASDGGPSDAA